jgi:hypothetical protein
LTLQSFSLWDIREGVLLLWIPLQNIVRNELIEALLEHRNGILHILEPREVIQIRLQLIKWQHLRLFHNNHNSRLDPLPTHIQNLLTRRLWILLKQPEIRLYNQIVAGLPFGTLLTLRLVITVDFDHILMVELGFQLLGPLHELLFHKGQQIDVELAVGAGVLLLFFGAYALQLELQLQIAVDHSLLWGFVEVQEDHRHDIAQSEFVIAGAKTPLKSRHPSIQHPRQHLALVLLNVHVFGVSACNLKHPGERSKSPPQLHVKELILLPIPRRQHLQHRREAGLTLKLLLNQLLILLTILNILNQQLMLGEILRPLNQLQLINQLPINLHLRWLRRLQQPLGHAPQQLQQITIPRTQTLKNQDDIIEDLLLASCCVASLDLVVCVDLQVLGGEEFGFGGTLLALGLHAEDLFEDLLAHLGETGLLREDLVDDEVAQLFEF